AEIDAASGAHRSPSARLVMKAIPGRTPIDTKALSELERRHETVRPGIAKIAAGPGAKGDSTQPVFLINQILSPQRDSQSGVNSEPDISQRKAGIHQPAAINHRCGVLLRIHIRHEVVHVAVIDVAGQLAPLSAHERIIDADVESVLRRELEVL